MRHTPSTQPYGVGTFTLAGTESISEVAAAITTERDAANARFMADAQARVDQYQITMELIGCRFASDVPEEILPYVSPILPKPIKFPSLTKITTKSSWKWRRPRIAAVRAGTGDAKHDESIAVGIAACAALGYEFWAMSPVPAGYWAVTPERTYTHVSVNRDKGADRATVTERDHSGATLHTAHLDDFDALVATHSVTRGAQLELTA